MSVLKYKENGEWKGLNIDHASTADSALYDGNGNVISTTYATKIEVPTATSELTNDSNFVSDASYVHTDNNYTTSEKEKLGYITTHHQYSYSGSVAYGSWVQIGSDISITPGYYMMLLYGDMNSGPNYYATRFAYFMNNTLQWERIGRNVGQGGGGCSIHRCITISQSGVIRLYGYCYQSGATPTIRLTFDVIRLAV